jgi:Zn finger protein HypA/HybF involved in hydrogenase expression
MTDQGPQIAPRAECICERCGRDYPIWFAENEAWNLAVNRTPEHGDEWNFLCPTCFVRLHEIASGRVYAWGLRAE